MEIARVPSGGLKLRGKTATVIVDQSLVTVKTEADVSLPLAKVSGGSSGRVEGVRLEISGPGDYEVGGIKIAASYANDLPAYDIRIDGLEILLVNSSAIPKSFEQVNDFHIVILHADKAVDTGVITSLTPRVVVMYGVFAGEIAKGLGKESPESVSKFQTAVEKLPLEMEVVVLG